jgi:hypothetical protein
MAKCASKKKRRYSKNRRNTNAENLILKAWHSAKSFSDNDKVGIGGIVILWINIFIKQLFSAMKLIKSDPRKCLIDENSAELIALKITMYQPKTWRYAYRNTTASIT